MAIGDAVLFLGRLRQAAGQLPPDDRPLAGNVAAQLQGLLDYSWDFHSAGVLLNQAQAMMTPGPGGAPPPGQQLGLAMRWAHIACRDAAMTVFHFGNALDALRQRCRASAWNGTVRWDLLKPLRKEFNNVFPGWEHMRHAVAHRAELYSSPSEMQKHAAAPGLWYQENLHGNTLHMTYEGRAFSCELSGAKHAVLAQTVQNALTAFEPILE